MPHTHINLKISKEWSQLGNKIVETSAALASAEKEIFESLRLEVIENAEKLRKNAQVIDELDVAISFAVLATEMNFVRPEITEESVPLIDLTYSASV